MSDFLEALKQMVIQRSAIDAKPPLFKPLEINKAGLKNWMKNQGKSYSKPLVSASKQMKIDDFNRDRASFRDQFETESDWAVACLMRNYEISGDVGGVLDLVDAGILVSACDTDDVRQRFVIEAMLATLKEKGGAIEVFYES